jgi:hypothetical protein
MRPTDTILRTATEIIMTVAERGVVRRQFSKCLEKAEAILGIMDRQTCTDPTFSDLLKLMGLRLGLKDEYLYMEEELDYFLQYDMEFVNEADFYEELCILGKATRKAVDSALSQSGEFLSCLTDVDGIFQSSKTTCLQLTAHIMVFVDRGTDVDPMEAVDLEDLRQTLGNKFARMKGSWENLLQSAIDYDESAVFHEVSELVEVTEATKNEALFGAEDLLQSLRNRDLQDWIGGDADDTPESDSHAIEDGVADSAPESEDTPESDSHVEKGGGADNAPKLEDSYHTETTEIEGASATFLEVADTVCRAAMEVVIDGMRAVEEN